MSSRRGYIASSCVRAACMVVGSTTETAWSYLRWLSRWGGCGPRTFWHTRCILSRVALGLRAVTSTELFVETSLVASPRKRHLLHSSHPFLPCPRASRKKKEAMVVPGHPQFSSKTLPGDNAHMDVLGREEWRSFGQTAPLSTNSFTMTLLNKRKNYHLHIVFYFHSRNS